MQNKIALLPARLLASLAITLIIVLPASKIPTGGKIAQNTVLDEFTAYLDMPVAGYPVNYFAYRPLMGCSPGLPVFILGIPDSFGLAGVFSFDTCSDVDVVGAFSS